MASLVASLLSAKNSQTGGAAEQNGAQPMGLAQRLLNFGQNGQQNDDNQTVQTAPPRGSQSAFSPIVSALLNLGPKLGGR
jgi:hypothetical protein